MSAEVAPAAGPGVAARPLVVSRARTARRILLDRWASRLVVLGGIVIIASILAILVVIVGEVWPLFRPPWAERLSQDARGGAASAGGGPRRRRVSGDRLRDHANRASCSSPRFESPATYPPIVVPGLDGARITAVAQSAAGRHTLGTSDGRIVPLEVRFKVEFKDGRRVLTPEHEFGAPFALDPEKKRPIVGLTSALLPRQAPSSSPRSGARRARRAHRRREEGADRRRRGARSRAGADGRGRRARSPRCGVDGRGQDLFLGTARGQLVRYDLRDRPGPRRADAASRRHGADHAAAVPQRRSHARGRRSGRRGHDVAGRAAAAWRRGPADADLRVRPARRRGRRGQPVAPGQGLRHRRCRGRPARELRHVGHHAARRFAATRDCARPCSLRRPTGW